jgi:uncharacterized Fe-S cluster protein YjdI
VPYKDYRGDGITVHFDGDICIHSENCVNSLPEVFRPTQRPWILATAASADAVAGAIHKCPSGALRYTRHDAGAAARASSAAAVAAPAEAGTRLAESGSSPEGGL